MLGVEDKRLGQAKAAVIALKPEVPALNAVEAKRHLREQVPSTHITVHWRFVDEPPKHPSMKIDRMAAKALFPTGD